MSSFRKTFRASRTASSETPKPAASTAGPGASGSPGPSVRGAKAWLGGQRLVSSGHRQLDELVGGGIVLGSTLMLEGDLHSDFADTLLVYSMVEALSNEQAVVLIVQSMREAEVFANMLPYNLTLADELEDEPLPSMEPLQIAWQYDKYAQRGVVVFPLLLSHGDYRCRAAESAE